MGDKNKKTNVVVLALIIILIAGAISFFDTRETTATTEGDGFDLITAAMAHGKGEKSCLSLTQRPCYMRGAKAPQFWTQVGEAGAKFAYEKCLLNPVLTGEALVWTDVCGNEKKEKMRFCYQGHGFALYYLNGECVECKLPYCA